VLHDLRAAFDTIDHNTLLNRFEGYIGLSGIELEWFKSYLSDWYILIFFNLFNRNILILFILFFKSKHTYRPIECCVKCNMDQLHIGFQ